MSQPLYISDLDGTLLNKETKVPEYTREVINTLIKEGILFSIATARSWHSASSILEGLNLTVPVVTYNGTIIVNPVSGDIIESIFFTESQVQEILDIFLGTGNYPLVYGFIDNKEKASWLRAKEDDAIRYYLNTRRGDERLRGVVEKNDLYKGDIFYFSCIAYRDELEPLIPLFQGKKYLSYNFQPEVNRDEYYWFEVKRHNATKAVGIETVRRITDCSKVISFGDNYNDIPMFSISDEAYAVSNAEPRLKAIATDIIDNTDRCGVARWLYDNAKIT